MLQYPKLKAVQYFNRRASHSSKSAPWSTFSRNMSTKTRLETLVVSLPKPCCTWLLPLELHETSDVQYHSQWSEALEATNHRCCLVTHSRCFIHVARIGALISCVQSNRWCLHRTSEYRGKTMRVPPSFVVSCF